MQNKGSIKKINLTSSLLICLFFVGCEKSPQMKAPYDPYKDRFNPNSYLNSSDEKERTSILSPSNLESNSDRIQTPTSSWQPEGSQYIYHQDGSSSWKPEGSQYIYHQNGTASWQPQGSQYIYHQDGSSSWKPEGSSYIYNQDGTSSWKP